MISIVIPCYNEEAVLPQMFGRVQAVLDSLLEPWEVICVDDGSHDKTWGMLCRQHERHEERDQEEAGDGQRIRKLLQRSGNRSRRHVARIVPSG